MIVNRKSGLLIIVFFVCCLNANAGVGVATCDYESLVNHVARLCGNVDAFAYSEGAFPSEERLASIATNQLHIPATVLDTFVYNYPYLNDKNPSDVGNDIPIFIVRTDPLFLEVPPQEPVYVVAYFPGYAEPDVTESQLRALGPLIPKETWCRINAAPKLRILSWKDGIRGHVRD